MSDSYIDPRLTPGRMENLTDCIFAFAMTLLVIGIDLPGNIPTNLPPSNLNHALISHILSIGLDFEMYVIAFITLGGLWYGHLEQFRFIKYIDGRLLWNNMIGLIFIAFLPYSTNLAGDYSQVQSGVALLEVNLLIIGIIFYQHWSYATSQAHLTIDTVAPDIIRQGKEKNLSLIALSLIALILSFLSPPLSVLTYLLLPFLYVTRYRAGRQLEP